MRERLAYLKRLQKYFDNDVFLQHQGSVAEPAEDVIEWAVQEIERLRAQLADSVSRETLIATEQERDEAREVAKQYFDALASDALIMIHRYPWLEDE